MMSKLNKSDWLAAYPVDLRPLFNHVLRLSIDSAKRGYCQRAGMELRHAKRLTRFKKWEQ